MESSLPTGRPVFARIKDLTGGGAADLPATFQTLASLLEDNGFDVVSRFGPHDVCAVTRTHAWSCSRKPPAASATRLAQANCATSEARTVREA